ncbi:MAG: SPOR domain-containing protein [Cyclobacteriaceae bacterium]
MKKSITILAAIMCFGVAFNATAQMDKQEYKEWKKRIKALEPEQYKTLIEENKSLNSQVSGLKKELAGIDDKISDKDDQIAQYQDQIANLRDQVTSAKKAANNAQPKAAERSADNSGGIDENTGIVFKVQIGAFAAKDLKKFAQSAKNFSSDSDGNINRYTIGSFRDYWEADTFKKYLREMGVKDAWIVSFKDGKRVPIKDVLEGVSKS